MNWQNTLRYSTYELGVRGRVLPRRVRLEQVRAVDGVGQALLRRQPYLLRVHRRARKRAGERCDHGQLNGTRECHGAFPSFLPLAYIRPSGASASRAFRIDQPSSAGPLANCSSALRCQPIKA
jgi:hypothetical protein